MGEATPVEVVHPEHLACGCRIAAGGFWCNYPWRPEYQFDTHRRRAEVEPLLERSLAIRGKALGPEHSDVE